jgi:hypothetical protein
MAQVLIKRGFHAGREHCGHKFTLVRGLSNGVKGPFLMVDGTGVTGFPQRRFKIHVETHTDFVIEGEDAADYEISTSGRHAVLGPVFETPSPAEPETDEVINERINERFKVLHDMTQAAAKGIIKGLVVSGASGVGKSFEVQHALDRDSIMDKLSFNPDHPDQDERRIQVNDEGDHVFKPRYTFVKGHTSAVGLYKLLYEHNAAREVLVFDDTDSVLFDETSLNLIKVALDTTEKRIVHWATGSNRGDSAPNSFEFKGSVIFITNLNFEKIVAAGHSKLSPHLAAIMSRCLYLDLTIDTTREKLLRIDYVARECKMLERAGLSEEWAEQVLAFVHGNAPRFRELSLRKTLQVADIRKMDRSNWERIAELTMLRNTR